MIVSFVNSINRCLHANRVPQKNLPFSKVAALGALILMPIAQALPSMECSNQKFKPFEEALVDLPAAGGNLSQAQLTVVVITVAFLFTCCILCPRDEGKRVQRFADPRKLLFV